MRWRGGTRLASVVLVVALVAGACASDGGERAEPQGTQGEPGAGTWDTWLLDAPDTIAVAPPPEGEAAVVRWGSTTADQPWTELHLHVVAERAKDPVAASRATPS